MSKGNDIEKFGHIRARRILATELKEKGLTENEIARVLVQKMGMENLPPGYDDTYVAKDIRHEMERYRSHVRQDIEHLKDTTLRRLERLWFSHYQNALMGDVDATKVCLKIIESQRKLMGLDEPVQVNMDFRATLVQQIVTGRIPLAEARQELGEEYVKDLLRDVSPDVIPAEDGIVDAEFVETDASL